MSPLVLLIGLQVSVPSAQAQQGRQLFHDPGIGKNGVACAQCHATVRKEVRHGDGLIRAGHTLAGVARRPYWRGDRKRSLHRKLSDAMNVCVQIFQGGEPLEGPRERALVAYLKSISLKRKRQPPLTLVTALEADLDYARPKYQGGDEVRGRSLFYKTCHGCHPHGQAGLGPAIAGLSTADVAKATREGNGLIRGSRRGSDWMPAFGLDRLSHSDVADIAAFIRSLPEPK